MDATLEDSLLGALPSNPALIEPAEGIVVTYEQLHELVELVARQLVTAGVRPRKRVVIRARNGPEVIVAFLAIAKAGAVAIPVNPALKATELARVFDALQPDVAIVDSHDSDAAGSVSAADVGLEQLSIGRLPHVRIDGVAPSAGTPEGGEPDDVCLVLQTSGTTSRPKTVPLRHRNLTASARTIASTYRLTPDDRTHCAMPLFHIHGLVGSALSTLISGGTVVVPRGLRVSDFHEQVDAYSVTWFSAVPTVISRLIDATQDGRRCATLRFARTSSSPLPATVISAFEERFEVPLIESYGMTEASHQMASNPLPPGERRPGSVGLPTGTEMAILDEGWSELPPGASGEVAVRGPTVIEAYLDSPEANATSFRGGWFRTGDLGIRSDDGYLSLVGRIKELINRGGEKIAPRDIDEVLLSHPAVREAVTFGVPDAEYGERVEAAVVVISEVTAAELTRHCAARLARFKVPARIRLVGEIPKGPTGKVERGRVAGQLVT
jgi:oxalate---CoA ligase